jgi:hypothetical protein
MTKYILTPVGRKLIGESVKLGADTHSIVDGLNRSKHAIENGHETIPAHIIDLKDLPPLSSQEAEQHDRMAEKARKNGDYFTGSTFGNKTTRYSVAAAIEHAKRTPVQEISTAGFVKQQVRDYWQGNEERTRKAIPSREHPIIIAKHLAEK